MRIWDQSELDSTLSPDEFQTYSTVTRPADKGEPVDISLHRGARRIVDLEAIAANYTFVVEKTTKVPIAVVKARAYGAGLLPVARRLLRTGCRAFAVESIGAAVALRQAFEEDGTEARIRPTIIVLGFVPVTAVNLARALDISVTLTDPDMWPLYARALESDTSVENSLKMHLKLDTGMCRVGVPVNLEDFDQAVVLGRAIHSQPQAQLEGIFTHFPRAHEVRESGARAEQVTLSAVGTVKAVVDALIELGIGPPIIHLANSGAIEQYPESHEQNWITHVRTGSLLHGVSVRSHGSVHRATRWEATLTRVERMSMSTGVGYGHTYHAWHGQHVGTVSVGYADGYLPAQVGHTNWIRLLPPESGSAGIAVPVIGTVAMDMCMVDLEPYVKRVGRPPKPGHIVELLSDDEAGDLLSLESLAQRWGVSWPIVMCGIRTRNTLVIDAHST